uniref:Uncharacterized protein n=1 Tax=Triticum urartu TaxID=4572 RepID=A0A8R7PKJ2_TRIUA
MFPGKSMVSLIIWLSRFSDLSERRKLLVLLMLTQILHVQWWPFFQTFNLQVFNCTRCIASKAGQASLAHNVVGSFLAQRFILWAACLEEIRVFFVFFFSDVFSSSSDHVAQA